MIFGPACRVCCGAPVGLSESHRLTHKGQVVAVVELPAVGQLVLEMLLRLCCGAVISKGFQHLLSLLAL